MHQPQTFAKSWVIQGVSERYAKKISGRLDFLRLIPKNFPASQCGASRIKR
jgi:hypothetical protein